MISASSRLEQLLADSLLRVAVSPIQRGEQFAHNFWQFWVSRVPSCSGCCLAMKHTRMVVTHYGGPDALQVVEEECPEPKAGEVRVRVLAAGVALPDVMMREGIHPETPPLPFTPGWDLIGVVDRLG